MCARSSSHGSPSSGGNGMSVDATSFRDGGVETDGDDGTCEHLAKKKCRPRIAVSSTDSNCSAQTTNCRRSQEFRSVVVVRVQLCGAFNSSHDECHIRGRATAFSDAMSCLLLPHPPAQTDGQTRQACTPGRTGGHRTHLQARFGMALRVALVETRVSRRVWEIENRQRSSEVYNALRDRQDATTASDRVSLMVRARKRPHTRTKLTLTHATHTKTRQRCRLLSPSRLLNQERAPANRRRHSTNSGTSHSTRR